jgi:hypothetical protein
MTVIRLPGNNGHFEEFVMPAPATWRTAKPGQPLARIALSAGHVVSDPWADISPMRDIAIDFEATQRFRDYLWDLGLGVAEAMDTAQRGMGLDWPSAQILIRNTVQSAKTRPEAIVFSGVGTDHIDPAGADLNAVLRAYSEQLSFVQAIGGRIIIMASRALVRAARRPADYVEVYRRTLAEADQPVILHWLGDMFDRELAGYWGHDDVAAAMDVCLGVIADNAKKIDGIKISLLDAEYEIAMRRRLPPGVKMYTGDDFNYPELIAGHDQGYSHALLGIFDAIAPTASAALLALENEDRSTGTKAFREIIDPTVALSRELFRAPTQHYKTGIIFLAYLNGHQDHFTMLGAQQGARSILHLCRVFRLAGSVGLFADPDRAANRMRTILTLYGMK